MMPLIIGFEYENGEMEVVRIPAEVWLMSEPTVTKVFATDRAVSSIILDPYLETADCDLSNNNWPPRPQPTRFEIFKQYGSSSSRYGAQDDNPMQRAEKNDELLNEKSTD